MSENMQDKHRFQARIAGQTYTILSSQTDEHLQAVVDLANTQLQQLLALDPDLSVHDRAILMAVNALSDQLLKERRMMEMEEKIETLESEIERIRNYQAKYGHDED